MIFYRNLINLQRENKVRYKALLNWMTRVCYFHASGSRVFDMTNVAECYNIILPDLCDNPFVLFLQNGEIDAQRVLDEPMISLETYDKFLTAVREGRASFTTIFDDLGSYAFEVNIGLDGDREKIATIELYTTMAIEMAE